MKNSLFVQIPIFVLIRTVVHTAFRMVYPFLPAFGRGLGVGLEEMSLALTFRSATGTLSPFVASIADSRGRKAGILSGLMLFSVGAALVGIWLSYPAFVAALALTILGNFLLITSLQAYLGDRVTYQRRGLALSLIELGWSLSFILGVPLVALLISRYGWQSPFRVLAGLGLAAFLVLAWLLPDDRSSATRQGLFRNLRQVFTYVPALFGFSMGMMLTAGNEVVNVVFGAWMENSFAFQLSALGAAAAILGFAELGGEILVSGLSDRMGKALAIGTGLLLNSAAALALPVLGSSAPGALASLFFFYLTFEFTIVSSIPLMTEVLPEARATVMAVWIAALSIGRAFGAPLSPVLFQRGMPVVVAAAAGFNLLALLALVCLVRQGSGGTVELDR